MSCNGCSGNFSSRSCGGYLQNSVSSCASSFPSNVFYSPALQIPITHQLSTPFQSGCQETFCEPTSCQTSYEVSRRCHRPCYRPRFSVSYSPCQSTFSGSLGFSSRGFQSCGWGWPSVGFGSHRFQSVGCGPRTFSSLNCGSNFYRPTYFSSKSCQSVSYRPACGSGFF